MQQVIKTYRKKRNLSSIDRSFLVHGTIYTRPREVAHSFRGSILARLNYPNTEYRRAYWSPLVHVTKKLLAITFSKLISALNDFRLTLFRTRVNYVIFCNIISYLYTLLKPQTV